MSGIIQSNPPIKSTCKVSVKNISLLRNPLNNGTPAMAEADTMATVAVIGMYCHIPLILRISRVPVSWSIMPAAINSEALKVA